MSLHDPSKPLPAAPAQHVAPEVDVDGDGQSSTALPDNAPEGLIADFMALKGKMDRGEPITSADMLPLMGDVDKLIRPFVKGFATLLNIPPEELSAKLDKAEADMVANAMKPATDPAAAPAPAVASTTPPATATAPSVTPVANAAPASLSPDLPAVAATAPGEPSLSSTTAAPPPSRAVAAAPQPPVPRGPMAPHGGVAALRALGTMPVHDKLGVMSVDGVMQIDLTNLTPEETQRIDALGPNIAKTLDAYVAQHGDKARLSAAGIELPDQAVQDVINHTQFKGTVGIGVAKSKVDVPAAQLARMASIGSPS